MLQFYNMRTIQKFLPHITLFIFALAFISKGILFDRNDINAQTSTHKVEQNTHFENMFQSTKMNLSDGKEVSLKDLKEPVVILNFWASWCMPCLSEFPSINNLIDKYPDMIRVIGINNDEEKQELMIKKIEKKYELKFSSLADVNGVLTSKFKVSKIPYSIVFVHKKVVQVSQGEYDFESNELKVLIENALKK